MDKKDEEKISIEKMMLIHIETHILVETIRYILMNMWI